MNNSRTSGSDRVLARNKGLAWVSALTLGAGAASALGAAAIAISLPNPSGTTAVTASAPVSPSTNTGDDGGQGDDAGTTVQQSAPLQAAQAPTTSKVPPVATTGAS